MSVATLIANLGGQTCTVTRFDTGQYVNGYYVDGSTSTFQTVISVQPVSGEELVNLPEGQRDRNMMKGYCADELFTAKQSPSKKADQVNVGGVMFEVQESQVWVGPSLSHWKVRLAQVNP